MAGKYKIVERLKDVAGYFISLDSKVQEIELRHTLTAQEAASIIQELGEALEDAKYILANNAADGDVTAGAIVDRANAILSKLKEA